MVPKFSCARVEKTRTVSTRPPFIDPDEGSLDTSQILTEAFPLIGLIALFGGLALIPYVLVFAFGGSSALSVFFTIVAQLILAVGTGIVLMYVIARGIQLAEA